MNRRDFLKLSSSVSAFTLASAGPIGFFAELPLETVAAGKIIYRGTKDGRVQISRDAGKTWQLHSKFPAGLSILDIFTARDKRVYIHMGYKTVNFHLALTTNGKAWVSQTFKTTPRPGA